MTARSEEATRAGETALQPPRQQGKLFETAVDSLDAWDGSMGDPQRDIRRIEVAKLPGEIQAALAKLPGPRAKTIGFKICIECGGPVLLNAGIARWVRDEDGRVELVRHHDCDRPHEFPRKGVFIPMEG